MIWLISFMFVQVPCALNISNTLESGFHSKNKILFIPLSWTF